MGVYTVVTVNSGNQSYGVTAVELPSALHPTLSQLHTHLPQPNLNPSLLLFVFTQRQIKGTANKPPGFGGNFELWNVRVNYVFQTSVLTETRVD